MDAMGRAQGRPFAGRACATDTEHARLASTKGEDGTHMKQDISRRGFFKAAGTAAAAAGALSVTGAALAETAAPAAEAAAPAEAAAQDKTVVYQTLAQLNPDDTSDWRSNSIEDFTKTTLFSPWHFGKLELSHRMVKSAAGSLYLPEVTDERIIDEYVEFIKGGCDFVWVEDYASLMPHYPASYKVRDASNAILDQVAAAVHEAGGMCGYQLSLMGASFSGFDATTAEQFACAEADDLTLDEVKQVQQDFIDVAAMLKDAGFDAVEINAAGNNIGQAFLSRNRNHREDEYGPQSFENRARFICEIVQGIKSACGEDFPVQILINGIEANDVNLGQDEGFTTVEENVELCKQFEAAGADSLHVRIGPYGYHPCEFAGDLYFSGYGINGNTRYATQFDFDRHWEGMLDGSHSGCGLMLEVAAKIKAAVSIPVGSVTYMDPAHAPDFFEKALQDGKVDFYNMTRPLYADPDYINKLREGKVDEIRPCNRCLHCHFDLDEQGNFYEHCRVNATRMRAFTPAMPDGPALPALDGDPKNVMVVGGGAAGMEAARIAALRGHIVTLYEKQGYLGGKLPFAAAVKGQHENIADLNSYLQRQQEVCGVTVVTGQEVDADFVRAQAPDVLIEATGGVVVPTGLAASGSTNVVPIEDILTAEIGNEVTIVGYGAPAVDAAFYLIAQGKHVTIVMDQPSSVLDKGQSAHVKEVVLPMLYVKGTRVWANATVTNVGEGEITINGDTGCDITIACDTVIEACELAANTTLADALGAEMTVVTVGDALVDPAKPHNIAEAIATGNLAARAI